MFALFMKRSVRSQSGQATIFFAVTASVLMGTMGLAVLGGNAYAQYHRLQNATDMAAIVGAQNLPCKPTDTACINTAQTLACTYATNNGFSGCTAGGASSPAANVPPLSCSPYDFINYGNDTTNANCHSGHLAPSIYSYIEVSLTKQFGTVPIFNIPLTLGTHAVARHGQGLPGDYALITLDPNTCLSMSGNTHVHLVGSAFGNGGVCGNGKDVVACNGGWFGARAVSGVSTNVNGTAGYAPPLCSGSNDSTPNTLGNVSPLADPYGTSVIPPTQGGAGIPSCPECSQPGWWKDLSNGTWHQGGQPGGYVEMFPGIYSGLPNGGGPSQKSRLNPGVYTFTGSIDTTGGASCIYGAPACEDVTGHCGDDAFNMNTAAGATWYHACSPYGFWDACTATCNRPAGLPTSAPTWYDISTNSSSTTPLNGVTFYMAPNAGGVQARGNSQLNYLAAPNPCPGTGTFTSTAVDFPAGALNATFDYTGTVEANHGLPALDQRQVYPSYDFSLAGECNPDDLNVWPGEMPQPQHLHFLFFMDVGNDSFYRGAAAQNYTGIWYAPHSALSLRGAGKGAGGSPWVTGQIVVNTADMGGNSSIELYYRPCGPAGEPCGNQPGTQLIQ